MRNKFTKGKNREQTEQRVKRDQGEVGPERETLALRVLLKSQFGHDFLLEFGTRERSIRARSGPAREPPGPVCLSLRLELIGFGNHLVFFLFIIPCETIFLSGGGEPTIPGRDAYP